MNNQTFAMIKPDAIKNGHLGKIIDHLLNDNFAIIGLKFLKMSKDQAKAFYSIHSKRPFYEELTTFMSSGNIAVLALKKENAVLEWRKTIGATNPQEADEGTIRKLYATSIDENAVHGSDSIDNAKIEIDYFFQENEICSRTR
jgi:nucleoside-diphosphate kinase